MQIISLTRTNTIRLYIMPHDTTLEDALRSQVKELFSNEGADNITVKRVRALTEQKLDLEDGWFKNDEEWKNRSKEIIVNEHVSVTMLLNPPKIAATANPSV